MRMRDVRGYIEQNLYIRTKRAQIVPLKLNRAQERLLEALRKQDEAGRPMRVIVLKARQLGFSTLAEALIFARTANAPNVNSLIVAHREDSSANLFKMSKLFFERLTEERRPMAKNSNARELVFENPERDPSKKAADPGLMSRIRCNTAGGDGIGRSDTLMNVHASEFAFCRWMRALNSAAVRSSGFTVTAPFVPSSSTVAPGLTRSVMSPSPVTAGMPG